MQSGMPVQSAILHHAMNDCSSSRRWLAHVLPDTRPYTSWQALSALLSTTRSRELATYIPQTLCLLLQVQKLSVRKIFMPVSRAEDGKAIPHGLADSAMGPTDQFGM